jgi:hypothetical protein
LVSFFFQVSLLFFWEKGAEIYFLDTRFAHTESTTLAPTWDWVNRVPALDNGENIWAIYATIEALRDVGKKEYIAMAENWQSYLDYLKITAGKVFFNTTTIYEYLIE